ncbi:MAG: methyltransferase domain-containing protein [Hamadaea sp.]|uniref:class I SAM-dependent methyltransferase n=1 Tax=Hamadaea sp. TaxID=2024425 RepID=UPI0017A62E54|nr:methyltransferase domain-containing protein [Hamadaea sp.]NUR72384.1 methyltransferase domain-containing protein [Hamadaea sp.]NUT24018.1 methyltransferase domain-containing protein [Hamadaea sp.]
MVSERVQSQVFGEVAADYDDVRPGYPVEIADRIVAYAGRRPQSIVEVGAGTGKGTEVLRTLDAPITCVEPDAAMAGVLRRRFADDELVAIEVSRFEDWTSPVTGVDLLASAQAWHWVGREVRTRLAAAALAPGGVIALFAHDFGFADDDTATAMQNVYLKYAPEIAHGVPANVHPDVFHPDELRISPLFTDFEKQDVIRVVPFPTPRYLRLLSTFSPHRMLPEDRRVRLHQAIADLIDGRGGVLHQQLTTGLVLARRAA